MLDYDVPSDDEDYDPAQRRGGDTDSLGAPTPRTGVDTGVSSPAPFGDDYSVGAGGSQRGERDEDGREDDDEDEEDSDEAGSGYDSDLAKEIEKDLNMANKGQGGTDESGSDDDDGDGLFGGSSDDDDDDDDAAGLDAGMGGTGTSGIPDDAETVEARKRLRLLAEEMGDLDRAIAAKEVELAKAPNPIFKVRATCPGDLTCSLLTFCRFDARADVCSHRNGSKSSSRSLPRTATRKRRSTPRSRTTSKSDGKTPQRPRWPRRPTRLQW